MVARTLAAASYICLQSANAARAATADGPGEVVAMLDAGLLAAMRAGHAAPFAARYEQLAPLIERVFDLPGILQAAVGPPWAGLTPADRAMLQNAFNRYTVSTYVTNFAGYDGERFVILPDRRRVGEQMVVATQIVRRTGNPARLDYVLGSLASEGGMSWKIDDVLLDGTISQVAVLRSEFHGVLRDGGAARLAARLGRKTADLSGEVPAPPGNGPADGAR